MNKIIDDYGQVYEQMADRLGAEEELMDVFHTMNINSNGRAMTFLALLYYKRRSGVDICRPIRLVANVLKLKFRKKSFWQRLFAYVGPILVCVLTHDFVKSFSKCYAISVTKVIFFVSAFNLGHLGSPMESYNVKTKNRYLENRSANEGSEITK